MNLEFTTILTIICSQLVLLFAYHYLTKKDKHKTDTLQDKLQILNAILQSTKHEKIYSIEKIKEIELQSDRIYVFSKDIYRDVKNNGQFSNDLFSISTFYETVKENLNSKKHYTYFIKKDANFKHSIISFLNSHSSIENVEFIIIPSEKYFFYDEVYLYYSGEQVSAYEFLPSISNEKEKRLFYIELDESQIKRLEEIKIHLITKYKDSSLDEFLKIKSKLSGHNGLN